MLETLFLNFEVYMYYITIINYVLGLDEKVRGVIKYFIPLYV